MTRSLQPSIQGHDWHPLTITGGVATEICCYCGAQRTRNTGMGSLLGHGPYNIATFGGTATGYTDGDGFCAETSALPITPTASEAL